MVASYLQVIELGIDACEFHQLIMSAMFTDVPVLENGDLIGHPHSTKAMSNQ